MRSVLSIGLIMFCTCVSGADSIDMPKLVEAFIEVESHGDDYAIGDDGRAVGCLQITPIMIREVNRLTGLNYSLEDRYSRNKSIQIFCRVMRYRNVKTVNEAVRVWNPRYRGRKYINAYERRISK